MRSPLTQSTDQIANGAGRHVEEWVMMPAPSAPRDLL